ncbi:MAG: response regulator transcription factor [Thermoanaerobaculia bacterium]
MSRLLLVDDDENLRSVVSDSLRRDGHEVAAAADGEEALSLFAGRPFDLVITDFAMPGMDGLALVRRLRADSNVPVLVLTVKSEEREKVRLLDAGADDYVVKPFGVSELLARVRALVRRGGAETPGGIRKIGNLEVDLEERRIRRGKSEIHLTPIEFELLRTFLSKPGRVWTHSQLIAAVWGGGAGVTNDTVRVQVGNLRRKIEQDANRPKHLITEPWVGYRFVADPGAG